MAGERSGRAKTDVLTVDGEVAGRDAGVHPGNELGVGNGAHRLEMVGRQDLRGRSSTAEIGTPCACPADTKAFIVWPANNCWTSTPICGQAAKRAAITSYLGSWKSSGSPSQRRSPRHCRGDITQIRT